MTDSSRNLPQEKDEMKWLSDSILDVWKNNTGAMKIAAEEIEFRRFWMDRMESDVRAGQELCGRALLKQGKMIQLINEVHSSLEEAHDTGKPLNLDYLILKITALMNAPAQPVEGDD